MFGIVVVLLFEFMLFSTVFNLLLIGVNQLMYYFSLLRKSEKYICYPGSTSANK